MTDWGHGMLTRVSKCPLKRPILTVRLQQRDLFRVHICITRIVQADHVLADDFAFSWDAPFDYERKRGNAV